MRFGSSVIAVILLASSISANAQNYHRYPMPFDYNQILFQKFPLGYSGMNFESCIQNQGQSAETRKVLGVKDPNSGEPVYKEPGALFIKYYGRCLKETIAREFSRRGFTGAPVADGAGYVPQEVWKDLSEMSEALPPLIDNASSKITVSIRWGRVSTEYQHRIIDELINFFVGPGVLESTDQGRFSEQIRLALSKTTADFESVVEVMERIIFKICMDDNFLRTS